MTGRQQPVVVAPDRSWTEHPVGDASRRLRVAIVIARLEGGAGALALRGAAVLDPAQFQVTVVTGSGQRLLDDAKSAGIEVILEPRLKAPVSPRNDLVALRHLDELFKERKFDVVHTHCAKGGAIGRLAAFRSGVPRIVHTYHGFPFHEYQSPARRFAYVAIERSLGRRTDLALCVGTAVAVEAIRRRLVAPDRVHAVGVTVDGKASAAASMTAANPEARRRARATLGLPSDAHVVGAVGRLTYQKAPDDFLAAVQAVARPDVIGVWVGDGDLEKRIARLARRMSGGQVVLAGERADVFDILPAFDVFVLPSRYEGLPTAVVEAMVCGVPVIATAVNAVPDVVIPGETGLLVPPCRPDLMAAAIRHLLDEPALASRMAMSARAHIGYRYGDSALRSVLSSAYLPGSSPGTALAGSLISPGRSNPGNENSGTSQLATGIARLPSRPFLSSADRLGCHA
jgi:glycosyltransferase involved in cell wall biosynthesis